MQQMVEQVASLHGVAAFHSAISIRSNPGFPDLVLVGPGGVLFRELKIDGGRVSEHQKFWIAALREGGADAGLWWEADWRSGLILREIKALGRLVTPRPAPKPRRKRAPNPYRDM